MRLNTRLLPALVGLLLVLHLAVPYRGWLVLLVGLGGAWLVSYVWARSLARGLGLVREMRFGWAQVGDRLEERFTLVNDGLVPGLWVEVVDHTTMPDYRASRVSGVGGGSRIRWHTKGVCSQRGLFTLGPTTLGAGDPFGIYAVTVDCPDSATLMVTPPILPLPTIEVAPGGRAGEGRPRANAPERTVGAASVRDYVHGDSLRWIHWPTSARRDSLFVKLLNGFLGELAKKLSLELKRPAKELKLVVIHLFCALSMPVLMPDLYREFYDGKTFKEAKVRRALIEHVLQLYFDERGQEDKTADAEGE